MQRHSQDVVRRPRFPGVGQCLFKSRQGGMSGLREIFSELAFDLFGIWFRVTGMGEVDRFISYTVIVSRVGLFECCPPRDEILHAVLDG